MATIPTLVSLAATIPEQTRDRITRFVTIESEVPASGGKAVIGVRAGRPFELVLGVDDRGNALVAGRVPAGQAAVLDAGSTVAALTARNPRQVDARLGALTEAVRSALANATPLSLSEPVVTELKRTTALLLTDRVSAPRPELAVQATQSLSTLFPWSTGPGDVRLTNNGEVYYEASAADAETSSPLGQTQIAAPNKTVTFAVGTTPAVALQATVAWTENLPRLIRVSAELLLFDGIGLSPSPNVDKLISCVEDAVLASSAGVLETAAKSGDQLVLADAIVTALLKARPGLTTCLLTYLASTGATEIGRQAIGQFFHLLASAFNTAQLISEQGPFLSELAIAAAAGGDQWLMCRTDDGSYAETRSTDCETSGTYVGRVPTSVTVNFSLTGSSCAWSAYLADIAFTIRVDGRPGENPTFDITSGTSTATQHETYVSQPLCGPPFTSTPQNHELSGPATVTSSDFQISLSGLAGNLPGTTLTFAGAVNDSGTQISGVLTWQRVDQPAGSGLNWTLSVPITLVRQ